MKIAGTPISIKSYTSKDRCNDGCDIELRRQEDDDDDDDDHHHHGDNPDNNDDDANRDEMIIIIMFETTGLKKHAHALLRSIYIRTPTVGVQSAVSTGAWPVDSGEPAPPAR